MRMSASDEVLFSEVQSIRQVWWIWPVVLFIAGLTWYAFFQQILLGKPYGRNPASDTVIWIRWLLLGIGLPWLLYSIKLTVQVKSDQIYIRYFPFFSRSIYFNELVRYEVSQYRPFWEYLGWGIRWAPGRGWAYTLGGNQGVQLELSNGQRLLVGSQQPETLVQMIEQVMAR